MIKKVYRLELITPCFCGGAEPRRSAEIRASSIRGQLRWWFRTLGGFASLPEDVRTQESMVFGSASGASGNTSKLMVRVPPVRVKSQVRDAKEMNADINTSKGYLLFPIRSNEKKREYNGRGVFEAPLTFDLSIVWHGPASVWPNIEALITVYAHLGALGTRSRRAMGALAFAKTSDRLDLKTALSYFKKSDDLHIFNLKANGSEHAISVLANWLKSWRSHGRSGKNDAEKNYPGFRYAKFDHDTGLNPGQKPGYRAALGLPIIQSYSTSRHRVEWKGRFASPVLLRPYRAADGTWRALVMFVDAHKWNENDSVPVDRHFVRISLDLYEEMKKDKRLQPFFYQ